MSIYQCVVFIDFFGLKGLGIRDNRGPCVQTPHRAVEWPEGGGDANSGGASPTPEVHRSKHAVWHEKCLRTHSVSEVGKRRPVHDFLMCCSTNQISKIG